MLPELKWRHPDWDGLEGNPGWKSGSRAYNQFHSTLKNHLYKEGKWIATNLPNRKQEKAKEAQDHDDSEDQSEAPKQEEANPMTIRYNRKRNEPENDTIYQDSTPAPNSKRQKVEKQDRKDKSPAKAAANQIVDVQAVQTLTRDEMVAEIKLVSENIKHKKMELNNLYKAYRNLREALYPGLDDPMADLK